MELLERENPRTTRLIEYLTLLIAKEAGKAEFHAYEADLHSASPFEVNDALDAVLRSSDDVESLAAPVAQFIRAVSKALEAYPEPVYPEGHLLFSLQAENRQLLVMANEMQRLSKRIQLEAGSQAKAKQGSDQVVPNEMDSVVSLKRLVASMDLLATHYVRLQNELFPLFEMSEANHSCVKLMWALQDRTLALKKAVVAEHAGLAGFWKTFGEFYFLVRTLLYREKHILFPVSFRSIADERAMGRGTDAGSQAAKQALGRKLFVSPTGTLDFAVLELVFKLLPLDIAFLDSDDRVAFYSDPPHRIFPRSPAVIGRKVQNCHPPKSVGTVEKILTSFKEGSEDSANFYLTVGGRFVHIEYFAVRNEDNVYLGTLEVTQDATHLRELVGEKRLL